VLQILSVRVADENHFLHEFAIRGGLRYDLPEDEQQFFDHVVLQWQHKPDDGHQQAWHTLAGKDHVDALLQRLDLNFNVALLCKIK
jgi:hypothetical protein